MRAAVLPAADTQAAALPVVDTQAVPAVDTPASPIVYTQAVPADWAQAEPQLSPRILRRKPHRPLVANRSFDKIPPFVHLPLL